MSKNAELMTAFQQRQAAERALYQAKNQYASSSNVKRRSELTLADLQALPEEAPVYRAVGRLFLRDTLPVIKKEIHDIIEQNTGEMGKLEKTLTVFQKRFDEADQNVRELAAQQASA
jgi:chaperonin cofactor prefoldin